MESNQFKSQDESKSSELIASARQAIREGLKKAGDLIEQAGDKVEHAGMKRLGDWIERAGDAIEHLGESQDEKSASFNDKSDTVTRMRTADQSKPNVRTGT